MDMYAAFTMSRVYTGRNSPKNCVPKVAVSENEFGRRQVQPPPQVSDFSIRRVYILRIL